ncbi:MAG: hypothetical protein OWP43_02430 [Sphaerochaetaceae bacterium]|nr:hypothetical protein [Sphaerochaetaceae bacterium]
MNNNKYFLSKYVKCVFITPNKYSHWFGYYNNSPLDITGEKLLAHRINFDARAITSKDIAEIGWFNIKNGIWHKIGETNSFNWQQGAMLQWYDQESCEKVIFNDSLDNHFISRIIDINSNNEKIVNWPIYGLTKDGKESISLQFERSFWCRAYHYESIKNENMDGPIIKEDGIFHIDMESGKIQQIINIEDIIQIDYDEIFSESKHWLEHILINPSGTRFAFYHRYSTKYGFSTRVFTANMDGKDLYLIPGWRVNNWSHMAWKNDNLFVIFGIKRLAIGKVYQNLSNNTGSFGKLIKKVYRNFLSPFVSSRAHNKIAESSYYQLYKDGSGLIGGYNTDELINDGHPSFTSDGNYMLTDTYGDNENYRHLLLFDIRKKKLYKLGKFYSPYNNCGYRSDLHPRFSMDYNHIIIDSAHSGKHQIMVFRLNWELLN